MQPHWRLITFTRTFSHKWILLFYRTFNFGTRRKHLWYYNSSHERKKKYWEQLEMRCRYNNRRNGQSSGTAGQAGLDINSGGTAITNSASVSGSIHGSCSAHCHPSLIEAHNPHTCGCGCVMNDFRFHHRHHPHLYPLHQHHSQPYGNNGRPMVHPILERPDFCAWDTCDDR